MRRRDFISLIGGAATTWPLVASAQHGERVPLVCILEGISAHTPGADTRYAAFLEGLQQLGWTPGRNVRIEVRYAEGDEAALQKYAAELVALVGSSVGPEPDQSTETRSRPSRLFGEGFHRNVP